MCRDEWVPVTLESVEVRFWCVFRFGHAVGDAPLATFATGGQADAFARNMRGGAQVVPAVLTYARLMPSA